MNARCSQLLPAVIAAPLSSCQAEQLGLGPKGCYHLSHFLTQTKGGEKVPLCADRCLIKATESPQKPGSLCNLTTLPCNSAFDLLAAKLGIHLCEKKK